MVAKPVWQGNLVDFAARLAISMLPLSFAT